MFVHVCRTGQADIRTISVSHWGSELGLQECIYDWEALGILIIYHLPLIMILIRALVFPSFSS